eukprot:TRINITY_DN941_c0_g3_i3.p2 TRINITY_DN941_c0_g3~~TRINITY_DN941_c0_g3_i3.p2  ORF type:complete len:327 (-),score=135.01 TRINITY_DN941_c0_g3_i3:116-1096(-)
MADKAPGYVTWNKEIDNGEFKRKPRTFRDFVSAKEGSKFLAEPNRYHLYISHACPWANRTVIVRNLKGLEDVISCDVVDFLLNPETGWSFEKSHPGSTGDSVNGAKLLREVYFKAQPDYQGSFTVPVLWDKKLNTIVNNESSEIIRMLNSEFNAFAKHPELDLYPEPLRSAIDETNAWVYDFINNGVYRCGFAKAQQPYETACKALFENLDKVEQILSQNRYLTGDQLTEADIRLWTTAIRFDAVYNTHFKCNVRRLIDYPNLWAWTRELYAMPELQRTIDFFHIKHHYYESHTSINPFRIVPIGPVIDYSVGEPRVLAPPKRARS